MAQIWYFLASVGVVLLNTETRFTGETWRRSCTVIFGARTTGNSLVEDDLVLLASAIASGPIDQAESETLESIRELFTVSRKFRATTPMVKEILEAAASEFRLPS